MKHSLSFERVTHNISRRFEWVTLLAFVLMSSACSENSGTDSTNEQVCGNGILEEGESCDGDILSKEASCPKGKQLPSGANFSCNADCTLNTDVCVSNSTEPIQSCGNGIVDDGEICDGELSKEASCPEGTHLPTDASLSCNADCSLNTDACVPNDSTETCGNGNLDEGEICDGTHIAETASCPDGMTLPTDANLSCNADCTLDTAQCVLDESPKTCGNDTLDEGEICDGIHIAETASCPDGMTLPTGKDFICKDDCTLDTSACEVPITPEPDPNLPIGLVDHKTLQSIPIHRTPQYHYPNDTLKNTHEGELPQIVGNLDVKENVNLLGIVGKDSYLGGSYLIKFMDGEYYIHSNNIILQNDIAVPNIEYSSASTPNYYQMDNKWKDTYYRGGSIGEMGGGPTAIANAISILKNDKDKKITPTVIAQKLNLYQDKNNGKGTDKEIICPMIEAEYELVCEAIDTSQGMNSSTSTTNDQKTRDATKSKLEEAFKKGWYVVALESGDYWSTGDTQHFLTIYGYDKKNDTLYVDDPVNVHYMQKGIEDFLDHTHKIFVITNTKVEVPKGTVIKNNTPYRRSPQDKFANNTILNSDHTFELSGSEPPQIAGRFNSDDSVTILGKVKKSSMTPEWYQISYNNEKYYILASDVKTNGVEVKQLPYFSGATNNYYQGDSQWGGEPYGRGNLSSDGCGPTSMANALSTLKNDKSITPLKIALEFRAAGAENKSGGGSDGNHMCDIVPKYGIKCTPVLSIPNRNLTETRKNYKKKFSEVLAKGGYIVVYQTTGYWTKKSHFILVYGFDGDYIYADDPAHRKYRQKFNDTDSEDFFKHCATVFYLEP